jgi:hypothetical protein
MPGMFMPPIIPGIIKPPIMGMAIMLGVPMLLLPIIPLVIRSDVMLVFIRNLRCVDPTGATLCLSHGQR